MHWASQGGTALQSSAIVTPLQGEKTARYLLERHERKYKAPMPGFEGFQHPGKAAGGEGEAELQDEGHEGAAGGEAGSSKEQAKAKEGGGSETDKAAVMTPVKKAGNKRRRKQVPGEGAGEHRWGFCRERESH